MSMLTFSLPIPDNCMFVLTLKMLRQATPSLPPLDINTYTCTESEISCLRDIEREVEVERKRQAQQFSCWMFPVLGDPRPWPITKSRQKRGNTECQTRIINIIAVIKSPAPASHLQTHQNITHNWVLVAWKLAVWIYCHTHLTQLNHYTNVFEFTTVVTW